MSKNREVAAFLSEIAQILELLGDNPHRINTYVKAARLFDGMTQAVEGIPDVQVLPGVGPSLSAKIEEFLQTGKSTYLEELKSRVPAGLVEMMQLPDMGPARVKQVWTELKITTVEELEKACKENKLMLLPRMGYPVQQKILAGIERTRLRPKRYLLGQILPLVEDICSYMRGCPAALKVSEAGSVRRRKDTIRDVDVLVSSTEPFAVTSYFRRYPEFKSAEVQGDTKVSCLTNDNIQVDLRVVPPQSWGAALQYFTGSKNHNIKLRQIAKEMGMKISEYHIMNEANRRLGGEFEGDIYRMLGMEFIPPELREDQGEIEAAKAFKLPFTVDHSQIKGDLHVHTTWSDGHNTIMEMAKAAKDLGYQYISVCDHSQGLGIANGMTVERALEQVKYIQEHQSEFPVRVYAGIEVDIRADGSYDFPTSVLEQFDLVVASVHSSLNQDRDTMTKRILNALCFFAPHVLAHPTGRMLNKREGLEADWSLIMQTCASRGIAMEINAAPDRLDMNDVMARTAVGLGVSVAINTDAHNTEQLKWMRYGVDVAARGWVEEKHVINTKNRVFIMR